MVSIQVVQENIAPIEDEAPKKTPEEIAAEKVAKKREAEEAKAKKQSEKDIANQNKLAEKIKQDEEKRAQKEKEDELKRAEKEREAEQRRIEKEQEIEERRKEKEAERMAKENEKIESIKKVREQEHELFTAIKQNSDEYYKSITSDCYFEMNSAVKMAISGITYGAIILGKGGTGKTFHILNQCFSECGSDDVAYTDSFTTPSAFYVFLFKNRDKRVIVCDDVYGLFQNPKSVSFLKGCLWHISDGKTRIVNYMTTKPLKDEFDWDVPSSFEMKARVIIITNELDEDNQHIAAVLSRVNYVKVNINRTELLKILKQIVAKDYSKHVTINSNGLQKDIEVSLSIEDRERALDFLEKNTKKNQEGLNIRTLLKIFNAMIFSKISNDDTLWERLSLKELQDDDEIVLVRELLNDTDLPNMKDKQDKYEEVTGKSRASFFRVVKKIDAEKNREQKN